MSYLCSLAFKRSGPHPEGEIRLCWYGHMECSNGAVETACDIQVDGKRGHGRPKMIEKQLTERNRREWKLSVSTFMTDTFGDLV